MIVRLMPRFEQRLEEIAAFLKERYGDAVARRAFNEILILPSPAPAPHPSAQHSS